MNQEDGQKVINKDNIHSEQEVGPGGGTQLGKQTPAPNRVVPKLPSTRKQVDLGAVESRIGSLEKNLKDLEGIVRKKTHSDTLVFTRIREELDALANVIL